MDLVNGRSRGVVDKPQPILPLIFTVPYSNEEILLLSSRDQPTLGVIYHPQKMDTPTPWKADCPHCHRGVQQGIDIAIKRAVRVICSRQVVDGIEEYRVPTNSDPCMIYCKRGEKGLTVTIVYPGHEPIDAVWTGSRFVSPGSPTLIRSKILSRTLKLLGSVKTTTKRNARDCLMPLLLEQKKHGINTHRRHPCLKIDWASIITAK